MIKLVDFHTHILPGIDDGCNDCITSLKMLRICAEQGISHVILTPHFYADKMSPSSFLKTRSLRYAELTQVLLSEDPPSGVQWPELILGSEVYYFPQITNVDFLGEFCIGDSNYLMIELPVEGWSESININIERLIIDRGIIPVFAHIERYIYKMKREERRQLNSLIEMGALVQANTGFISSLLSRRNAIKELCAGRIHLIGSDCHNLKERPVNLRSAYKIIEKTGGDKLMMDLKQRQNQIMLRIEADKSIRDKLTG